jgi:hypothetical protein
MSPNRRSAEAQQNRSAIGTALSLIELRDYRTRKNSWEKNTLCYRMLVQAKSLFLGEKMCGQQLFTMKRLFVFLKVHNPS